MAIKPLTPSATTSLGNAGTNAASVKTIQLTGTAFSGSLTVVGRRPGGAWVPIPYKSRYLNGVVGTDAYVSTAITADSLIEVHATGIEVGITANAFTGAMSADHGDARL